VAASVVETRFGKDWEPFRQELILAVAADQARPYWEVWAIALEALLLSAGPTTAANLAGVQCVEPARVTDCDVAHSRTRPSTALGAAS
jgi:hypothetical protein